MNLRGFLRSFVHATRGLGRAARGRNFRVMAVLGTGVVLAGVAVGLDAHQWIAVALSIGLVLCAESFNTALEALADAVHPEQHPLVGVAKDVAAGAALMASVVAAVVGLVVFWPR